MELRNMVYEKIILKKIKGSSTVGEDICHIISQLKGLNIFTSVYEGAG